MPRIVVLSPHSDDGVLSIGASMARWARCGADVELLTVLALDPESSAPTGGWDRRAGFATEGAAARARRAEDAAACGVLGVQPRWLPFGSVDYERHSDDETIGRALQDGVGGAEAVLVPGFPLSHPDHSWLHHLARSRLPAGVLALYAEQPYTLRDGASPFAPVAVDLRDRVAKWRAVRVYRSQLPLLAISGARSLLRVAWTDERVEWPAGLDGQPL